MEKRHIAILGSTGSIGRQALDVIRQHRDLFEVELLTANNSSDLLIQQAIEFDANAVVICNEDRYKDVADALEPHLIKVFAGMQSVCDLVTGDNIDIVLTSMVGFSGLSSTVSAVKAGKTIALANKETLVVAGKIVMDLAIQHNARILPVDSEHSAIFQCLMGSAGAPVEKIHLTASGGPFRTWSREDIAKATREQALNHPNWSMGSKITIDSATMMNKGLEIIEARWLFGTPGEKIQVVVHPESIVHSLVEFTDGATLAQLSPPDMRVPIQYALTWPRRLPAERAVLDLSSLSSLTFRAPDEKRFPALRLVRDAERAGGTRTAVLGAADEIAVSRFLAGDIRYTDIVGLVADTVERAPDIPCDSVSAVIEADRIGRELAKRWKA